MEYLATIAVFFYNHEKYVKDTIESIIAQESKYPFKVLLIDDHSTDNTRAIIDDLCNLYKQDRLIKVYNEKNMGINDNFEQIISILDTKYFFIIGGDDFWIDPHKVEKQLDILEKNPEVSYVHTGFRCFVENTGQYEGTHRSWKWKQPCVRKKRVISQFVDDWSFYPLASTSCMRTDILKRGLLEYNSLLHSYVPGEGTFINVSMCMLGEQYYFLPDITTVYRIRNESLSKTQDSAKKYYRQYQFLKEMIDAIKLIGLNPKRQHFFYWYSLTWLSCLAKTTISISNFKKNLKEMELEIPWQEKLFFKLITCCGLFITFNTKMLQLVCVLRKFVAF